MPSSAAGVRRTRRALSTRSAPRRRPLASATRSALPCAGITATARRASRAVQANASATTMWSASSFTSERRWRAAQTRGARSPAMLTPIARAAPSATAVAARRGAVPTRIVAEATRRRRKVPWRLPAEPTRLAMHSRPRLPTTAFVASNISLRGTCAQLRGVRHPRGLLTPTPCPPGTVCSPLRNDDGTFSPMCALACDVTNRESCGRPDLVCVGQRRDATKGLCVGRRHLGCFLQCGLLVR